jgi:hypothetical protein
MELSDAKRKQYKLAVGLRILTVVIAVCLGGLCVWASFIRRSVPFLTSDELWKALGLGLKQSETLSMSDWELLMKGHRVFTVITVFAYKAFFLANSFSVVTVFHLVSENDL